MVAIEGLKIDDCLSFITYVESLNFDAYLAVTPLYAKPGVFGQYRWFKTILDAVTKPVMLYNIPSRSGTSLSLKALELLVGHKNLWAVKEASGSNDAFGEYAKIISSYSGDDGKLNDFISLGAKGLVSVASNCWPKETNLYVKLSMENKVSTADLLLWKEACDALFIASNPIPVKSLLYILGRIKTAKFRLPLAAEDLPSVRLLEEADSKIRSWFK
jgi:4-hydroxy-tetrahydrodipicolinate synthase